MQSDKAYNAKGDDKVRESVRGMSLVPETSQESPGGRHASFLRIPRIRSAGTASVLPARHGVACVLLGALAADCCYVYAL